MKLLQTNLYDPKPERPLEMYYKPDMGVQKFPQECFESDLENYSKLHQEWKRRQVKPEFEDWKNFNDEFPKIKTKIYVIHRIDLENYRHPHTLANVGVFDSWVRTMDDVSYEDEDWIWTYAESYDKKFDYYEQHRLKYEGFELVDGWYLNGEIRIYFEVDSTVTIKYQTGSEHIIYYGHLSQSLFNKICQENGITIKEI
jgi:hypothetical protein